ncbi:succinate-semialdehyde dehydrogenase / glutarate-semialdehyde dehydrogenase [Neorhodopirellula lusitana]|uniref:Succinate-semialdehyde dehydrogenase / glutarate-semialdehyde dehydrogenase n=1 Tax=Neorhodopirellula lusitana TaxID=445327 RepID=A0ABY1Q4P5_9BACT|nr:NAD-dependent succinate-semialdehyde dehydrogenase [Neorhodopirellula lusitana]SMP59639.1 succinate-semialdehyde dehydrogenase / glutarate-semialdehyde dehydrogenase [Neorhodopirellula lusitana]
MTITSINPATNQTIETFTPLTKDETLDRVGQADKAYRTWRTTDFNERKQAILTFANQLRERQDEFAHLITVEMGKRISESHYEVEFCAEIAEFYANGAERFLADQPMTAVDANAYLHYEPLGVLMGVMPWNFPFYQVTRFAVPNIMAGNAVMVKHASNVPQCAEAIADLFEQSGIPTGVYTNLFIPSEFVEAIVSDSRVQGVSLTGSEKAGAAVAALAGKNLKRSVLELGGNDPFIVLEDAEIDKTVQAAVKGRMVNAGQSCVAAKRFIVVEAVADEFLEQFKEAMASMKMGDPLDEETTLAPLSTEAAAVHLHEQVQSSIDAGATVLLGGDRPDRDGAFFNPTILTGVTPDMPTYDQELFGPVATVYVVKDEEAAIELANDSSYGLGGSVYTTDVERGRRVAERVETGMVFLNQPTNSQAELPFGGIKNSGYGRELSHLGILEFVNKKLIHLGN